MLSTKLIEQPGTYNKKVRLEYWIVYLSGCNREVQYLCTRELKVEFDVSSFVSSANATLSLGSLKLVDADAVYRTTLSVLSDFRLDNQNLIYLKTDNCPVMRGSQKGLVSQMKDHCPNMLDIDGCGCHKMNLVQKDATQSDKVAEIITFAEHLSNFLENKPKVQSILQQCQQMLGLTRINGHCPTRFLSLFNVLNSAYEQFNLLKKIICISNDFELKASLTSTKFLIHLDQFLIHTEPIYIFTKQTQSPDITLYECLSEMLRLISKLLTRLGHCISLTPEDYHHKLYRRDAPICFQRGKTEFSINGNNQDVQDAADSLSQSEINSIKSCWDKHNEEQLYRLLKRFKNFLTSQIVRRCHIIKSADHDETFLESFKQLCGATQINKVKAVDELSSIRVEHKSDTLEQMFADGRLGGSPHLTRLVQVVLLALPHNMIVESGFSMMKSTETLHQSKMTRETHDARRIISSFFNRNDFEKYQPPKKLLTSISESCSTYKKLNKEKKSVASDFPEHKNRVVSVYKRRTVQVVSQQLSETEKELAAAEKLVDEIRSRKRKLESENKQKMSRLELESASIIDSMFN